MNDLLATLAADMEQAQIVSREHERRSEQWEDVVKEQRRHIDALAYANAGLWGKFERAETSARIFSARADEAGGAARLWEGRYKELLDEMEKGGRVMDAYREAAHDAARYHEALDFLYGAVLNDMTARDLPHEWAEDSAMGRAAAALGGDTPRVSSSGLVSPQAQMEETQRGLAHCRAAGAGLVAQLRAERGRVASLRAVLEDILTGAAQHSQSHVDVAAKCRAALEGV